MPDNRKYTYPNTKQFLAVVAIGAFAVVWLWLLDVVGVQGVAYELALYLPGAVVLVWTATIFWRLKKSSRDTTHPGQT
jgi:hypothetical protein